MSYSLALVVPDILSGAHHLELLNSPVPTALRASDTEGNDQPRCLRLSTLIQSPSAGIAVDQYQLILPPFLHQRAISLLAIEVILLVKLLEVNMRVKSFLAASTVAIGVAAFVATLPSIAYAGGHGGGHGGGGHGGGHIGGGSFSAGSIGGSGFRSGPVSGGLSRGAPMIRSSPTIRTFSRYPSTKGFVTSHGYTGTPSFTHKGYKAHGQYTNRALTNGKRLTVRDRKLGSSAFAMANNRQFDHRNRNLVTGSVQGAKHASMLHNDAFAKHLSHNGKIRDFTKKSFQGNFADKHWDKNWHKNWNKDWNKWHWRHHHPIIVAGWYGDLWWPYAYGDFIDYTFWPYAYDVFWPYAYDDLYEGVFGPYAYEGPAYADVPPASRRARRTRERSETVAVVCSAQAPALTNWPIQQITQTVQPDQAQQSALNDLKDATAKAVNVLQAACPDELPSTPTGRLEAMRKRIGTMSLALSIVQPPLQRFYDSLNDEQKARFNVIGSEAQVARASSGGNGSPDLSQVCGEKLVKANVPSERILQALKPTDAQRSALDALNDATKKAADFLKANCPVDEMLTPPSRVASMEKRLNAIMEGIKIVQPALENFYGSLTDEQKARFNQLRPRES